MAHQSLPISVFVYLGLDRKQVFCFILHGSFWIPLELCLGFTFLGTGHTVWNGESLWFQYYVKNMRALFSFVFHIHFLRGAEGDLNPNLNGRFRLSRFENHVLLVILLNGCLSLPRVWL